MPQNFCQHPKGCRNPVRPGQKFCHLHGGTSGREEREGGGVRSADSITIAEKNELRERRKMAVNSPEWPILSRSPMPQNGITPLDSRAQEYMRHVPVREDAAEAVLRVSRRMFKKMSLEAPAEAARHRGSVNDFAHALGEEIGHDRVMVVRMQGLTRLTTNPRRPRIHTADAFHDVLMVDYGTENEVIVDPFIATFATVPKSAANSPVMKSGVKGLNSSPYVDAPWIGEPEDYRDSGFMSWDRATRAPGR